MPSSLTHPVRIVGGGMTGLTLGYRLSKRGIRVVIHERDPYLGGLASEGELGGIPVEKFYHCILPSDVALLRLLNELGIEKEVGWARTRTGFFSAGRLLEMTTMTDFLRFPALSFFDRLRLGWTVAYCGLNRDWERLDRESIGTFLRRHGGRRLFESIWEPLLFAKLGPDYDRFAASFIWATVYRMLSARKAKGRSEKLGFVSGRYGKVFRALREAIESGGGEVRVGCAVERLSSRNNGAGGGWAVRVDGKDLESSGVALCVPAPLAAQWLSSILPDAAQALRRVEYLGVVCEALILRRSLSPYYVLNLIDRSLPFTGVIEMTNLTGREEFDGNTVVYLPRYRNQHADDWDTPDEVVHQENLNGLRRIFPDLVESDIRFWKINRARFVQPVHPVGWGSQLPPVRLAPGLAYVSTAQVHPWPVFNDEVVRNVSARLDYALAALETAPEGDQKSTIDAITGVAGG